MFVVIKLLKIQISFALTNIIEDLLLYSRLCSLKNIQAYQVKVYLFVADYNTLNKINNKIYDLFSVTSKEIQISTIFLF